MLRVAIESCISYHNRGTGVQQVTRPREPEKPRSAIHAVVSTMLSRRLAPALSDHLCGGAGPEDKGEEHGRDPEHKGFPNSFHRN